MTKRESEISRLASGFRQRTLTTARLATRMGTKYLGAALGSAADAPDDEAAHARAEALVEQLGRMKGLVMKVGQMASYLPGALPPNAQKKLAELQAKSTPMSFDRIDEVIRAELGRPADEAF